MVSIVQEEKADNNDINKINLKKDKKKKEKKSSSEEKSEKKKAKKEKKKQGSESVLNKSEVPKKRKLDEENTEIKEGASSLDLLESEQEFKKDLINKEQNKKQKLNISETKEVVITIKETDKSLDFSNFEIQQSSKDALIKSGITALFPIQAATYNQILNGSDLLGRARTGTGKTLAFALPMMESLKRERLKNSNSFNIRGRSPKVLVMAPTRELASQVAKVFGTISDGLKVTCIYGGVPYDSQYVDLKSGVDVVVGTPGRLIDHVERTNLKLESLKFLCLDEADQMLDIGFAESMDKILQHVIEQKKKIGAEAQTHQTLLFSATVPEWVKECIGKYMKAERVTIDLIGNEKYKASETVQHFNCQSRWQNRTAVLGDIVSVYGRGKVGRTIIFVETKGEANELAMDEKLKDSQVIHGDIVQKQREISLQGFRDGKFSVLIATNVCARGVDIPEIDLVVNCEPPSDVETYIHRSGRTGRAGKAGVCVTFYKPQQEYLISNIARKAGVKFQRIGAPQPEDIIKARASDTVAQLETIDPKVLDYFTSTSENILDFYNGDSLKATSAIMAIMCGTLKPLPPRSLLSANEGFLTLIFQCSHKIHNVGYVRSKIQHQFPKLKYDDTSGWRMTQDETAVVVDFKSEIVQFDRDEDGLKLLVNGVLWRDGNGITVDICKDIPELKEFANTTPSYGAARGRGGFSSRGSFRGSNSNRGGRGSFGSARGSRGGFSVGRGRGSFGSSGNPFDRASTANRS
ncbi:Nucleolar RNA helicase 2 [Lobulomyces angularis]|nr:Nucleolar RNA helicase 2 [Lobulomyces angularis]